VSGLRQMHPRELSLAQIDHATGRRIGTSAGLDQVTAVLKCRCFVLDRERAA
jgi:hypothetical protein